MTRVSHVSDTVSDTSSVCVRSVRVALPIGERRDTRGTLEEKASHVRRVSRHLPTSPQLKTRAGMGRWVGRAVVVRATPPAGWSIPGGLA